MKLGETVTYPGLEGVSLCESIPLQFVCSQCLFWESCIWHEHNLHPPRCAGSYHLDRMWSWRWRGYGWSLVWAGSSPLLRGQHHSTGCRVNSQAAGAEALRVRSKMALFPLSVCSHPSQHWHIFPKGEQCWARGAGVGAQHGLGHGLGKSLHQSGFLLIPYLLPLQVPIMAALACLDAVLGLSWLCPLQLCIPLSCGGLCPSVELFHGVRGAGVGTQLWLGHIGAVERNWSEFQTVLIWDRKSVV